jgi:sugar phosphate isomerase/epimerase
MDYLQFSVTYPSKIKLAYMKSNHSRRAFLRNSSFATLALVCTGQSAIANSLSSFLDGKPNSKIKGVQIGAITYSWRSMPGSVDQLLQYCVDCNISAIELMGDAVEDYAGKPASPVKFAPGQPRQMNDEQKALMAQYQKAGVRIYAFKPNALNPNNTDAEIEYALKAAKALGANSVTVELPTKPEHSERLGKLAEQHKVYIGYHAHTQATDTAWDLALSQSPYNSMNLDCGHYIAAGGKNTKESLLALIEAKHDRITSMHIKDRKSKEYGGANMVWGNGNTPLKEILNLLKEKKYKIPATIELEYDIPAGSDAVKETKICFDYAKKLLEA